jgi:hypothetical protein
MADLYMYRAYGLYDYLTVECIIDQSIKFNSIQFILS